jgi:AcrR family transcriptional regulator
MSRKYQMTRRAERQAETRNRIVEATVELHTSVGPARTTISAIAERAGVQRHTVYAHFLDERQLFTACVAHWSDLHPMPDPSRWSSIPERDRRLRAALDDLYAWYEEVELDLAIFRRDAQVHALTAERVAARSQTLAEPARALARGWPRRKAVRAAIGHALEFETWRSLVRRQGLTQAQAIDTMVRLVDSAERAP